MILNVAAQGENLTSPGSAFAPIFENFEAAQVVGKKLIFDKDRLRTRLAAAPISAGAADQQSILQLIIEAIRAFLRRIVSIFKPQGYVSTSNAESVGAPGVSGMSRSDVPDGEPALTETDSEVALENLPEPVLERVKKTLNEMVDSALGEHLPDSLKAALKMPELGQKQAIRVLLEKNCTETLQMRSLCTSLQTKIDELVTPFAEKFRLDHDSAVAIFRADLESGGGTIANMVDPKSELRSHISELKRLESALAGHARARAVICEAALRAGVYEKEGLATLLAQEGLESDFLSQINPSAKQAEQASTEAAAATAAPDGRTGTVVSMHEFRNRQDALVKPVEVPAAVVESLDKLEAAGAVEEGQRIELDQAVMQEQLLREEESFDIVAEVKGDDLGDFVSKRNRPKNTP